MESHGMADNCVAIVYHVLDPIHWLVVLAVKPITIDVQRCRKTLCHRVIETVY